MFITHSLTAALDRLRAGFSTSQLIDQLTKQLRQVVSRAANRWLKIA